MSGGAGIPGESPFQELEGDSFFGDFIGTITEAEGNKTLISFTTPISVTARRLIQLRASCRIGGRLTVELNGTIIASGRTAPGHPNVWFNWVKPRLTENPDTVSVNFELCSGGLSGSTDLEAYLEATDQT